jgi:hypothetical protein
MLSVDITVSTIQPLSSSTTHLKDDAVYWQLPAQRINRRRQSWSSNVRGIWVGKHCRLPTSEKGNIYNYSLHTILQVNILVLDTGGFSTIPTTTSMNVICTKHTSEGARVCRRMVYQAVAAECSQERGQESARVPLINVHKQGTECISFGSLSLPFLIPVSVENFCKVHTQVLGWMQS